jgi:hypothetical protein
MFAPLFFRWPLAYTSLSRHLPRPMHKAILLILLAAVFQGARASTLYICVDEFKHPTYTNNRAGYKNCKVASRDDTPRSASPKSSSSGGRTLAKASPADFPRVTSETQKSRDGDRRYILEQEVASEKKNLDEARKSLVALLALPAAASTERTQPIRDRIALHERNLNALQREISNLK